MSKKKIESEPRREPLAHIKSLEFDEERKILVVEGNDDRLFLEYLANGEKNKNTLIVEIGSVEIPTEVEGGQRGRVLYFASSIPHENERIKFLVDRDYSKYTNENLPQNIILTDFKDLEGYLYEEEFVDKFLKMGIKTDKIEPKKLLFELSKAKYFGFVRIASLANNLNLSVNKTHERLSKYIVVDQSYNIAIKEKEYLMSLISNSAIKPQMADLEYCIGDIVSRYSGEENRLIVHGKDAFQLIGELCQKLGFNRGSVDGIFWMCFDAKDLSNYPNLKTAVDYIKN